MRRSPRWQVAGLVLVSLAMGRGSYWLLARVSLARATPPFSSVRTDPSGASVLFGALQRAHLQVTRGFEDNSLARMNPVATVAFVIAPAEWENGLSAQLETLVEHGGRVVLAAPPAPSKLSEAGLDVLLGAHSQTEPSAAASRSAALVYAVPIAGKAPAGVAQLPLRFPLTHLHLSREWTPLYHRDGRVYMAERSLGQGQVVLASEATFLSNQSLAVAPDTALLSWLVAGRSSVWVDETLHGLQQVHGVAWLLRRYRLRAATLWLLATLALMAWGAAASLERPPAPSSSADVIVMPTNALAGYVGLLRRAIPLEQLALACRRQAARASRAGAGPLPELPQDTANPADLVVWFRRLQAALRLEEYHP